MSSTTDLFDISCFDEIIGLSRTDCACFGDNYFNVSKSNLMLDETEGLNLNVLSAMEDCARGELWQFMNDSLKNGIMKFIGDVNSQLGMKYQLKREPFKGHIGQTTFKNSITSSNTYMYERFYCADVVSGKLKINGIGTCFEQTGTLTVWIYNNENTLLHTLTLNTTANKHTVNTFTTPIELELHGNYIDNKEYYFVYAYNALNKPKDISIGCGCDKFKPTFDIRHPYCTNVLTPSNKKYGWSQWMMAVAGSTNTLDFMPGVCDYIASGSLLTNGLTFDIELSCNVTEVICQDSFDFVSNPVAISTALAIRYAAARFLVAAILGSNNINRYTMANGEFYQGLYTVYEKNYAEQLKYIVDTVSINTNDCYTCKDVYRLIKTGIMA